MLSGLNYAAESLRSNFGFVVFGFMLEASLDVRAEEQQVFRAQPGFRGN